MEGLGGGREGLVLDDAERARRRLESFEAATLVEKVGMWVPLTDAQQLELGQDLLSRAEESGEKLRKALLGL